MQLGSGTSVHPFKTVKHYDDWLSRIDDFVIYLRPGHRQYERGRSQKGVVQPRILVAKSLPQIQSQIVDSAEESGFWAPIENMPEDFSDEPIVRAADGAAFKDASREQESFLSYRTCRRISLVTSTCRRHARRSVCMRFRMVPSGMPTTCVRITTTDLTPDEIHQIGLNEVDRVFTEEMHGVMEEVGFEGDLKEFFRLHEQR